MSSERVNKSILILFLGTGPTTGLAEGREPVVSPNERLAAPLGAAERLRDVSGGIPSVSPEYEDRLGRSKREGLPTPEGRDPAGVEAPRRGDGRSPGNGRGETLDVGGRRIPLGRGEAPSPAGRDGKVPSNTRSLPIPGRSIETGRDPGKASPPSRAVEASGGEARGRGTLVPPSAGASIPGATRAGAADPAPPSAIPRAEGRVPEAGVPAGRGLWLLPREALLEAAGPWPGTFTLGRDAPGPVEMRSPEVEGMASLYFSPPAARRHLILEGHVGVGPSDTTILGYAAATRQTGYVAGVSIEEATWLDATTNTGKHTRSAYLDLCSDLTLGSPWATLMPCLSYGHGQGEWRERDALNRVVESRLSRSLSRAYARFIVAIPTPGERPLLVEGMAGYSEDPFLYGAYVQGWARTPLAGLSVGVEAHGDQRVAVMFGRSVGLVKSSEK